MLVLTLKVLRMEKCCFHGGGCPVMYKGVNIYIRENNSTLDQAEIRAHLSIPEGSKDSQNLQW